MTDHGLELRTAIDMTVQDYVTKAIDDATTPLRQQAAQLLAQRDDLAHQLSISQTQNAGLQTTLAERDQMIATLNGQIAELLERIAQLEEPVDPLRPTLIGASATSNSAKGTTSDLLEFNRLETISGKPLQARRTFETLAMSGTAQTWASLKAVADVGKRRSVVSFKVDLAAFASGSATAKSRLWNIVSTTPYDHDVDYTIHHEPDPEVPPAQYIAAYRNFSLWMDEFKSTRKITKFWCLTGWGFYGPPEDPTRRAINWWPGDAYVDLVATDSYNFNTTKYVPMTHAMTGAVQAWQFAKDHGKRFGIAEWGCYGTPAAERPRFITEGTAWAKSLGRDGDGPVCEYLLWFHSNVNAKDPSAFWLDGTQASLDAWKTTL